MFTRVTVADMNGMLTKAEDLGLILKWEEEFTKGGKLQYKIWPGQIVWPLVNESSSAFHNLYGGVFDVYSVKEAATYLRGLFTSFLPREVEE